MACCFDLRCTSWIIGWTEYVWIGTVPSSVETQRGMKGQWFWNGMSEKGAQETNEKEGHSGVAYQLTEYMARATMM